MNETPQDLQRLCIILRDPWGNGVPDLFIKKSADVIEQLLRQIQLQTANHEGEKKAWSHDMQQLQSALAPPAPEAAQVETHAVNDRLIALYDSIAHTAGITREIAVAETGYFVRTLVQAVIENTAQSAPEAAPEVCDCGAKLTQCSDCSVSDYQAQHPDCPQCCSILPGVPEAARDAHPMEAVLADLADLNRRVDAAVAAEDRGESALKAFTEAAREGWQREGWGMFIDGKLEAVYLSKPFTEANPDNMFRRVFIVEAAPTEDAK